MKAAIFAVALVFGTAATAQTDPNGPMVPPGDGITQQGTNPDGQPCTPAGFNQGSSSYPPCGAGGTTTQSGTGNPPACSRTVTDGCIQTYERGVRRPV